MEKMPSEIEVTPRYKLPMTQCNNEFTYASHCISKNVTPCRMLKKCLISKIAKINRWNNSFQNMYDMLLVKVDRFARKTFFFFQKNAQKQPFLAAMNPGYPDFGRSCMPNYWD